MSEHFIEDAIVMCQEPLANGIFSMWIKTKSICQNAKAGQFITLYSEDNSRLLPRPISICEIDTKESAIRLVYRVAGKGTQEFAKLRNNDKVKIIGPLGNGYSLKQKTALLIAGGIGIPPLLELAKVLSDFLPEDYKIRIVLGYRDNQLFLKDEFSKYGKVYVATEDGSVGTKGNVIDVLKNNNVIGEEIYACGPMPMLRAIKQYANEINIEAQLSLEERMACGIGACLGCVTKTTHIHEHTNVNNARICMDGPVFLSTEVDI